MVGSPYQCVGLKIDCPYKSKSDGVLKVLTILNTKSIEVICTITEWLSLCIFEAPTSTIIVELCYFEIMEEQHLYTARQHYERVVLDVMRSFSRTQSNSVVAATATEPNRVENRAQMVSILIVNGNALRNLSEEDSIVIRNIDNLTQLETLTLE